MRPSSSRACDMSIRECFFRGSATTAVHGPLVYALRSGTTLAKQNTACALLSLSGIEKNRATIGASGAIPPLVALLFAGSTRGKKVGSLKKEQLATSQTWAFGESASAVLSSWTEAHGQPPARQRSSQFIHWPICRFSKVLPK